MLFHTFLVPLISLLAQVDCQRIDKLLSIFNFVRFPNDACVINGVAGTCFTATECSSKGGSSIGGCAQKFGVCCQFSGSCGSRLDQNCTIFSNPDTVTAGDCTLTACPCSDNICQLRLDFETFQIAAPSDDTNPAGKHVNGVVIPGTTVGALGNQFALASRCMIDQFTISSPGNPVPPTICGLNTGEHVYVDSAEECNNIRFTIGNAVGPARSWRIKVTQLACDSPVLAPSGCTKYFFGENSGVLMTANLMGGRHLANQRDRFCIRRERGRNRICYSTRSIEQDFDLTGTKNSKGRTGNNALCGGYGLTGGVVDSFDVLIIPQASKMTNNMELLKADEFCGGGVSGLKGGLFTKSDSDEAKTVCSMSIPFIISFYSDSHENPVLGEAAAKNSGFRIIYEQFPM